MSVEPQKTQRRRRSNERANQAYPQSGRAQIRLALARYVNGVNDQISLHELHPWPLQ